MRGAVGAVPLICSVMNSGLRCKCQFCFPESTPLPSPLAAARPQLEPSGRPSGDGAGVARGPEEGRVHLQAADHRCLRWCRRLPAWCSSVWVARSGAAMASTASGAHTDACHLLHLRSFFSLLPPSPTSPCASLLATPAGSIEEKIFQRQLAKEGLSRVVVDDHAEEQRTFSRCCRGCVGRAPRGWMEVDRGLLWSVVYRGVSHQRASCPPLL